MTICFLHFKTKEYWVIDKSWKSYKTWSGTVWRLEKYGMQACEYSYTLIDLVSTRFSLIIIFTIMYIFQIHLTLCNSANMYFTYMQ